MRSIIILFLAVVFWPLGGHAGESYKWTDEKGKVHYGNTIPAEYKQKAEKVPVIVPPLSEKQTKELREREKAGAEAEVKRREEQQKPSPTVLNPPPDEQAKREPTCAEQWQAYDASGKCFDPYRVVGGGIKAEAFKHCTEMKRPYCERPRKD